MMKLGASKNLLVLTLYVSMLIATTLGEKKANPPFFTGRLSKELAASLLIPDGIYPEDSQAEKESPASSNQDKQPSFRDKASKIDDETETRPPKYQIKTFEQLFHRLDEIKEQRELAQKSHLMQLKQQPILSQKIPNNQSDSTTQEQFAKSTPLPQTISNLAPVILQPESTDSSTKQTIQLPVVTMIIKPISSNSSSLTNQILSAPGQPLVQQQESQPQQMQQVQPIAMTSNSMQPASPMQIATAREINMPVSASKLPILTQLQLPSYGSYNQLYLGHNPFIEILRPHSYADDNIMTLNLSHSHIYEIDSEAFVGQRFEHIDLSNNKLGLIHSRSFRIGPNHSRHNPYNPHSNTSQIGAPTYPTRRPPPSNPKSVTIDFSHNPAIVALSGAFDQIDVPNCLLNFTNSTVELKFGAFKKYFWEHPGHIVDIESVDCCEQEWLLSYKHNFVARTHCDHDPNLLLNKVPQQVIIDSCITYVTSARRSMTIQGPSLIHQVAAAPRSHPNSHSDNQHLTYLILGGTAMILTSLSIYIIFYMFSLKAAFVYQMQTK